jgi:hypothetical protein
MTTGELEKKADRIFSNYIRMKAANEEDRVACCTCGIQGNWKEFDCGHYLSRSYLSIRYDETNAGPQCQICNRIMNGRPDRFRLHILSKYGEKALERLIVMSGIIIHNKRIFLQDMIDLYNKRLSEIKEAPRNESWGKP